MDDPGRLALEEGLEVELPGPHALRAGGDQGLGPGLLHQVHVEAGEVLDTIIEGALDLAIQRAAEAG